jgi:WD40 repeat protein
VCSSDLDDKTIRFWNPKDGKSAKELKGHTGGVSSLAFSPDGQTLASGSSDKTVRLWNVKEGKELKNLGAHTESVYSVAFSKDGSELASTGNDGIIKIWDVKGMKEIKSLKVDLPKPLVKIEPKVEEPKKKKDVKGKKDTKKKMTKKVEPKELRDAFTVVAFTPDSKQILSVGHDKFLRYWNIADGKEAKKIGPTPDYIFGLSISKDGKYVATAGYGGSLRVYELTSGNRVFPPKDADPKKDAAQLKAADQARRGWITYCATFTPDGKSVVTGVHEIRAQKYTAKVTNVMK